MFNKKYKEEINKLNNTINNLKELINIKDKTISNLTTIVDNLNEYIDNNQEVFELYNNINQLEDDIHITTQRAKEEEYNLTTILNEIDKQSITLSTIRSQIDIDWLDYVPKGYFDRHIDFYDNEIKDMLWQINNCDFHLSELLKQDSVLFMLPMSEWNKHHNKHDKILYLAIMAYTQSANGIINQIKYNNYKKQLTRLDVLLKNINNKLSLFDLYIPDKILDYIKQKAEYVYKLSCLKNIYKEKLKQIKEQEAEEKRLKEQEELLKQELKAAETETEITEIKQKLATVKNRQKFTRAGWVYVISNDDMKDNLYKIGITRRENYLDRIEELSNASHAYHFKVHGVVWSEDCFKLENDMHKYFSNRNINPVHFHKEHFYCTLEEIEEAFRYFGYNVTLDKNVIDEEYIESKKILAEQNINI